MATGSTDDTPLARLFEKVTVMHASRQWAATERDLSAVLGAPRVSDGTGWATFGPVALSDEPGPEWSLLAKTADLAAVKAVAARLAWSVGESEEGGHETRVPLTSPAGLRVVAYAPVASD